MARAVVLIAVITTTLFVAEVAIAALRSSQPAVDATRPAGAVEATWFAARRSTRARGMGLFCRPLD